MARVVRSLYVHITKGGFMPVTVTSDPGYKQAMVTVENLRKMANNRVEQLQRQNGVRTNGRTAAWPKPCR